jgi:hypothetical protein
MMEFTDEQFMPSNIRPVGQQDSDAVVRKPSDDLAAVDHHNDRFGTQGEWPVARPNLGRGPTQDGGGGAKVVKPVLDVKPNYPAGVGGFALRPNTNAEGPIEGPEDLSE